MPKLPWKKGRKYVRTYIQVQVQVRLMGDGHVNVLSCVLRWGEAAWHTEQSQQREKCDIKQTWNKFLIVCIFGFIFFPKSLTLPLCYVTGSGAGLSNSEISPLSSLSNPNTHSQLAFRMSIICFCCHTGLVDRRWQGSDLRGLVAWTLSTGPEVLFQSKVRGQRYLAYNSYVISVNLWDFSCFRSAVFSIDLKDNCGKTG